MTVLLCWASGIAGFMCCALLVASREDDAANAYLRHLVRRKRQQRQARMDRALSKHIAAVVWNLKYGAAKADRVYNGIPLGDLTIISTRSEN